MRLGSSNAWVTLLDGKQTLRAYIYAIFAGGALFSIHQGQAVPVHGDGVEVTHHGTICQADAAPGATLGAAGDNRRGAAGLESTVAGS